MKAALAGGRGEVASPGTTAPRNGAEKPCPYNPQPQNQ